MSNKYKKDINESNALGSGGTLIRKYANFIKNMWHGDSRVFSPWGLKNAISQFQSMFSGYSQHDSSELINFLLDGLHEDTNRIIKKEAT